MSQLTKLFVWIRSVPSLHPHGINILQFVWFARYCTNDSDFILKFFKSLQNNWHRVTYITSFGELFFCILHFCHTCSLCRVELVVQFPARGSTQVFLCLFPGVLWLWHFLYSVGPHPVSSLHIYTFVVLRAFMAGAASQAGDADSSRAPGLTSGLQGSFECPPWCSIVGATVTVHQFFCILHSSHTLNFCQNLLQYPFKNMFRKEVYYMSSTAI